MPEFQDRKDLIDLFHSLETSPVLVNIYGEAGIGKTRLMEEVASQLIARDQLTAFVGVNLKEHENELFESPEAVISLIYQASEGKLRLAPSNAATNLVTELNRQADLLPVYLYFDNTDELQNNRFFWDWMEENIIGPLVAEGNVRQIYAGRIPVYFKRWEVRRMNQQIGLKPLDCETSARALVMEVLTEDNAHRSDEQTSEIADMVLSFSFGHPELSIGLAEYTKKHRGTPVDQDFKKCACKELVIPFIESNFLENIEEPWDKLLWPISILEWFDPAILQDYLNKVEPSLSNDKDFYFFTQGISQLRNENAVLWRETRGDRLHGVIKDIMRRCLKVSNILAYKKYNEAAAETLQNLIHEFSNDDPECEKLKQEIEYYQQQAGVREGEQ
jgi:hypothetical protein